VEHVGKIQLGGQESGAPWNEAVCTLSEEDIAFSVHGTEVARVPRSAGGIERAGPDSTVYRITGLDDALFFHPRDDVRFRIDLEGAKSTADRIALATSEPVPYPGNPTVVMTRVPKSKMVAGLLAIFLGAFGIHKFYLNQNGAGLLYLLFCWTGIPLIIGLVEGIIYLATSDEDFARQYG
jgi:TM2 domain-containing membrane protein YozV